MKLTDTHINTNTLLGCCNFSALSHAINISSH